MLNHIRVKRMWAFVHQSATQLSLEELAHISECTLCFNLFKLCARAEAPARIDFEADEEAKGKTA